LLIPPACARTARISLLFCFSFFRGKEFNSFVLVGAFPLRLLLENMIYSARARREVGGVARSL